MFRAGFSPQRRHITGLHHEGIFRWYPVPHPYRSRDTAVRRTAHRPRRAGARHAVHLSAPDKLSPLTVGNGDFAFTVDITGLQTFPDFHADKGIPLGTQSNFGWHEMENTAGARLEDALVEFDFHGRRVPYLDRDPDGPARSGKDPKRMQAAIDYFRENPHRFDLGRLGLVTRDADGKWSPPAMDRFGGFNQTLDLWTGCITSRFTLDGVPIEVKTVAWHDGHVIALEIHAHGPRPHPVGVRLAFPYASAGWRESADWQADDKHTTTRHDMAGGVNFQRVLSGAGAGTSYNVDWNWAGEARLEQVGRHSFVLPVPEGAPFWQVVDFHRFVDASGVSSQTGVHPLLSGDAFARIASKTAEHWQRFWLTGGCIDLSGSKDPRWRELERRIVLSQYLTAVNCAGSLPPQETGLVYNSWHGKFHLEMHWWHAAHFALWGRRRCWNAAWTTTTHPAAGAANSQEPGLRRCPLAENDRPGRAREPERHRACS